MMAFAQLTYRESLRDIEACLRAMGPTEGNVHDVNVLDHLVPIPGAYYVMDRDYLDFERLYTLHTLLCVYLIMAITKKRLNNEQSLYAILQILSVSVFEKIPLLQAFQSADYSNGGGDFCNQLSL